MDFIAFDLETTGIVPGVDQIVEIGAVRFINGEPESIFSTLVCPRIPIPPSATAVNKITNEMVKDKPLIEDLLPAFTEFCQQYPLVAHNAPFDFQFLLADYKKFEIETPQAVVLDTLPISRKVFSGLANYKLGTLVTHLKIDSTKFHRAEEDAHYVGKIFIEIKKRVSVNGQEPNISNYIALTGKPQVKFPIIERKPKQLDFLSLI